MTILRMKMNSNSTSSISSSNTDLSLDNLVNCTSSSSLNHNNNNNSETESINVRKGRSSVYVFIINYYQFIVKVLIGFLISGLRNSGPVPKHVAIIMDGNRRYAKKKGFSNLSEGHMEGAKTLEKLLDYGFRLGIKTVTVYAFSIENFKRPVEEVDLLMSLAAEKLRILSQKSELIQSHQVRINVLGAIHLLPKSVQIAAAEAMLSTLHHENFILNICFPYTSTYEISEACKTALQYTIDTNMNNINYGHTPLDNPMLFDYFLDTWDSPPLEILVRTSGEARLSEFLMWQVCRRNPQTGKSVQVHILDALWPEFGFTHLLAIILKYQTNQKQQKSKDLKNKKDSDSADYFEEIQTLKEWRRLKKIECLKNLCDQ